jgi:ABC-type transport system involved in cytochrome c biogenesis ATPase subunit
VGALVLFFVLVNRHQRARARREWFRELASLHREGLARGARDWEALPLTAAPRVESHPYADDLDVYGRASLTQILGPVGTAAGVSRLDEWLLRPGTPEEVAARQAAVHELAALPDLRAELAVHARRTRGTRAKDIERFLAWAESPPWLRTHALVRVLAWLLPIAFVVFVVTNATGLTRALWIIPLLIALVVYFGAGARMRNVFDRAFGREALFEHYPQMLELLSHAEFASPLLQSLRMQLIQDGVAADARIRQLSHLMHLADLRSSSIHLPVFLVTMWDVHVLRGLEQWQVEAGPAVREWLEVLGTVEALSALATLHYDEPAWAFAHIDVNASQLAASQLGHPLLRADARVSNDVTIGPRGTFLLVTGSNMSGKSTLLRSLGVNAVLAQAGGPVCAEAMTLPPLQVYTSIRVQDSLARGVSYFMAELQRLKLIVDAAQRLGSAQAPALLFLLDEILHGTNTAERRIAARHVISHLVETGAIGAVTTHDLELADEPALRSAAQLVHFREQVTETSLTFDYKLRSGLATSTNALQLMRLVGL